MTADTPMSPAAMVANRDFDAGLRLAIASTLGESGYKNRDRYDAFGWEVDPSEQEYAGLYLRNPYANGLIDKPAQLCWRHDPAITDRDDTDTDTDTDTSFEDAVDKLARNTDAWTYATRAHRAAGIGEYALLFIDFADTDDLDALDEPVDIGNASLDDIRGYRTVPQFAVEDVDDGDFGSERWGEPEEYLIDWSEGLDDDADGAGSGASHVHHSRVVEVPSQPPLAKEYASRPRMEPWLNALYDIEKLVGAAAEMSFRGADKGLNLNVDPEKVDPSTAFDDAQKQDIQEWLHGLQPTLNTVGTEVTDLGGEIRDPSAALDAELKGLSAATGFSKQFIEGAAAGEIASSETNMRNDFGEIRERQRQYAEPYIARRLIDTLRKAGVLPEPEGGDYTVTWPDLFELSDEEEATVEQKRSQTAKNLGVLGEPAKQYVKTGEFPDEQPQPMPPLDESSPAVANQFEQLNTTANDDGGGGDGGASGEIDLTPPDAAQDNAEQVRAWRDDPGKDVQGMTETGWDTAAKLASGEELDADWVQQIAAWFARHPPSEADLNDGVEKPWRDNGRVATLGWGGEAMREWVAGKRERLAEIGVLDPVANAADYDAGAILTGNATRYEQGDTVSTPQGVGVVTAVATEPIESDEVEDIDASPDSPTYMVVVEDNRVGADFYKASDVHSTTIETDIDPTASLAEDQSANSLFTAVIDTLTANDFSPPQSWRTSSTSARLIALKAFASMGADFDGCVREMRGSVSSPERFCGSFLDYVIGNDFWRGDSPLPGE